MYRFGLSDAHKKLILSENHPLQSVLWGQFKKTPGTQVAQADGVQVFFHKVPGTSSTFGYFPRGNTPTQEQMETLKILGKKHKAIAIRMEPNVAVPCEGADEAHQKMREFLKANGARPAPSLFTPHSFWIDLSLSEEELTKKMKSKTRYNLGLARRNHVEVVEDNSLEAMERFITLLEETTLRQGFHAHGSDYYRRLYEVFKGSRHFHILEARLGEETLASWILFSYGETLYYPYGASSGAHSKIHASNLLLWEAILLGKKLGLKTFDLWGALGPKPDPKDPWYGFHKFKEGYGGTLMEFIGTYDLVLKPKTYWIFRGAEAARKTWLHLKIKLKQVFKKG